MISLSNTIFYIGFMSRIKYIDIDELKADLEMIIAEVAGGEVEYHVMDKKQPKAKITAIAGKDAKKVLMAEREEEKALEDFVE